jgi:ferritin-like metal-binding protein YciE
MTPEEWELKKTEEDMIIENAEIIRYNMIVQKAQIMNIGDAVPLLRQSLLEEESMAAWLKSITPVMITHLWPK